ncbi:transmembrane family protein [Rhodococcus sp. MTM3W5.2]|uniref:TIGR02611 family protein n=1 Tax=Rhodococcus sp. MTM3W5.2 TaxID=1805827 RepID=UPI00097957FC|nr:TIGR02611 family protein [Rhodococcus sp. MTM3W5.2]AQA23598.1 transmembrane family protein [Rhodococcus sp. MTM3W5.2]
MRLRRDIAGNTALNLAYRICVGVVGTVVLVVGIITIPYPGPGWLIVFAGLGILASEFAWAHRVLRFARERYDRFMAWFVRQSVAVKALSALLTCVIVIGTLWVLGTLGLIAGWVGIEHPLLESPL